MSWASVNVGQPLKQMYFALGNNSGNCGMKIMYRVLFTGCAGWCFFMSIFFRCSYVYFFLYVFFYVMDVCIVC